MVQPRKGPHIRYYNKSPGHGDGCGIAYRGLGHGDMGVD